MKNAFKLFGIAVLVTAIGFSAASCKNEDDGPISVTVTGIPADTNEREAKLILSTDSGTGTSEWVAIPKEGGSVTFDITIFGGRWAGPDTYNVELELCAICPKLF